jgi:nucleoside-diphosphate-sugar epimerase
MDCAHGAALAGKRILIMGATGFIGSHLDEYLAGHGAMVFCAARRVDLSLSRVAEMT